jgi:tRNA nucleotidyltransferase (CCA-adding enzyme)
MARDSSADLAAFYELVRASEERGEPVRIADLAVDGHDLMALGFKPGRPLQDVFCDLLEVIWNDPAKNTREMLLQEAARMLE